jgi:hypothetical protein
VNAGIEVSLVPKHYGYFEEEISVYNTHSRDPALRVKVCLFVEEKLVRLNDESTSTAEGAPKTASDGGLDFGCVYLRPRKLDEPASEGEASPEVKTREKEKEKEKAEAEDAGDADGEDESDEVYSETGADEPELEINASSDVSDSTGVRWKTVVVENVSGSDLLLRARTEFDLGVVWRQHGSEEGEGQTDDQHQQLPTPTPTAAQDHGHEGGLTMTEDHLLKAGEKARLLVSLPLPTYKTLLHHVTTSQAPTRPQRLVSSLLQGQRVDVLGMISDSRCHWPLLAHPQTRVRAGNLFLERHVRSKLVGGREKETLQCCRIIPIRASYAISMARLQPREVKLDTIADVRRSSLLLLLLRACVVARPYVVDCLSSLAHRSGRPFRSSSRCIT